MFFTLLHPPLVSVLSSGLSIFLLYLWFSSIFSDLSAFYAKKQFIFYSYGSIFLLPHCPRLLFPLRQSSVYFAYFFFYFMTSIATVGIFHIYLTYCDVPPESRDIGARIYDCSRDNGVAKHVSPTTNNNSWERCVTRRELEPLWKVFTIESSENLFKEYSRRSQFSDNQQPEKSEKSTVRHQF
jgi:hypothetical protein